MLPYLVQVSIETNFYGITFGFLGQESKTRKKV